MIMLQSINSTYKTDLQDELNKYKWSHICHLTFKYPKAIDTVKKQFARWIRGLEQENQKRVNWFYSIEQHLTGLPHLHALLGNTHTLKIDRLKTKWIWGNRRIQLYDQTKGGLFYVTKDILWSEWDMNIKGFNQINN